MIKIDSTSFLKGFKVEDKKTAGTANWSTSFGQSKTYEPKAAYKDFFDMFSKHQLVNRNVAYKTKGGKLTSPDTHEFLGLLSFDDVSVNGTIVENCKPFKILAVKDVDDSKLHTGRMIFRYGPTIIDGVEYNKDIFTSISEKYNLNFLAYGFEISNNSIDLKIVSYDGPLFKSNDERKAEIRRLIDKAVADDFEISPYVGIKPKAYKQYDELAEPFKKEYLIDGLSLRKIEQKHNIEHNGEAAKSILNKNNISTSEIDNNKGILAGWLEKDLPSTLTSIDEIDPNKYNRKKRKKSNSKFTADRDLYGTHEDLLDILEDYSDSLNLNPMYEYKKIDYCIINGGKVNILEVKSSDSEIDKAIGQLLRYKMNFPEKNTTLNIFVKNYVNYKKYNPILKVLDINIFDTHDIESFFNEYK